MTVGFLFSVSALMFLLGLLASSATRALTDFPRHELKQYCDRKGKPHRYKQIMDVHEELGVATQSFQMTCLCVGLMLGSVACFIWKDVPTSTALLWFTAGVVFVFTTLLTQVWIPVAIAATHSISFLFHTWPMWQLASRVIHPLVAGVQFTSAFFSRLSGTNHNDDDSEEFDDEILSVVSEYAFDGEVGKDERLMIEGVIKLDDNNVASIMTPRSKVDSLSIDSTWDAMVETLLDTRRSRLPVYEGNRDTIVGMLFAKDVLAEAVKPPHQRQSIHSLMRKPLTVTENTRLNHLLKLFLESHVHLAIVVDEAFSVAGIVTIEDVIEEIVGEIVDEVDTDEPILIRRISDKEAIIEGHTPIDDINAQLHTEFPENGDYDTIAGLILTRLKDIPKRGKSLNMHNAQITIEKSTLRQIASVRVKLQKKE
jgi:CBS domain containing-hemolysin-like protein